MGRRLLNITENFGLLRENKNTPGVFSLTEYGRQSLENKQIFIPETDTWRIWTTDDPLLRTVLHIEKAKKESRGKPSEAPPFVQSAKGIVSLIRVHHTRSREIEIKRIWSKVRKIKNPECELYLELSAEPEQPLSLELSGSIGKGDDSKIKSALIPPDEHSYDSILQYLVRDSKLNRKDLDVERLSMACSFEDLSEDERKNHSKSVEVRNPKLTNLGSFDNMNFKISIHPRSAKGAKNWADWKFWDGWNQVPWPDVVGKEWKEVLKSFDWSSWTEPDPPSLESRIKSIISEIDEIQYPNLKARTTKDISALSSDQQHLLIRLRTRLMKCHAVQDIGGE